MSKKTIEQKTAETILQKVENIQIGDEVYVVAPPSIATLIIASEIVAEMPKGCVLKDDEEILKETLRTAKDFKRLGELLAVLILGAKGLTEEKKRFFGLIKTKVDKKAELSDKISNNIGATEYASLFVALLTKMQVSDFFGIITFLTEITLTKATREVI
jgi:hypothetical protein